MKCSEPLDDEVLLRSDGTGVNALLADALGSPLALLDGTGTPRTEYVYGPFGSTIATGAVSTNSNQYTGRENDGTGLYFYRARYYAPELQRFISEDPIGEGGGLNLYAYVDNDPILGVDPMGLQAKGRQPDGSYRANLHEPDLGGIADTPWRQADRYFGEDDQCVALTRHFTGAPCTKCWRKGPPVLGNTKLAPGTLIATFDSDGRYPKGERKNSALYVYQSGNDILVVDQFPGQHAKARWITPHPRNPRYDTVSNQSGAYYVVIVPPGTRSSRCQCLQ